MKRKETQRRKQTNIDTYRQNRQTDLQTDEQTGWEKTKRARQYTQTDTDRPRAREREGGREWGGR